MPVIEFAKLKQTQQQVVDLLPPIAAAIPSYRDTDPTSKYSTREKACHDSFSVLEDYGDDIHSAISGIDCRIRAYHATRIRDIKTLHSEGLLQLDIDRTRADLLQFAEKQLGKPVSAVVIEKWIEEIQSPAGYFGLSRITSKGPVFSLGVAPMFRLANTGRYFLEGAEIIHHVSPVLSGLLHKYEAGFTLSDKEFLERYWAGASPALVICDLQYDHLLPEKQEDIRRYLMKAALYQDSTDDHWQGGWLELSVNQDVPAEWFADVLVPDINQGRVSFNSELDYYRQPTYWEL